MLLYPSAKVPFGQYYWSVRVSSVDRTRSLYSVGRSVGALPVGIDAVGWICLVGRCFIRRQKYPSVSIGFSCVMCRSVKCGIVAIIGRSVGLEVGEVAVDETCS